MTEQKHNDARGASRSDAVLGLPEKLRAYVNDNGDWAAGLLPDDVLAAADEIERLTNKLASLYCVNGALRTGHDRYETARRMNQRQWADAWKLNLSTGKPFDEIIDDMRPFMVPNAELRGAIDD